MRWGHSVLASMSGYGTLPTPGMTQCNTFILFEYCFCVCRSIYSTLVPLGWFTKSTLLANLGSEWPKTRCSEWYMTDSQSPSWRSSLPLCPCIMWQAYVDFGRFLPDLGCNLDNSMNPEDCPVHTGAKACFKAIYVS
jgi:hypothetical protein